MSRLPRRVAFYASAAVLFVFLVAGMRGLAPLGGYQGVYGARIDEVAVGERRVTDVVSAVTFDYRGFDTLGEELILFTSVIGVTTLLRRQRDEREERPSDEKDRLRERRTPRVSDAVRTAAVASVTFTVTFGAYLISHGTVSPGGGFQGGVALATAPLVIYLAAGPQTFTRIAPEALVTLAEASAAAAYLAIGALGIAFGRPYLTNVLPLGKLGTALSGGTIFVLNLAVGLEVAAAFVLLLLVFVREALEIRMKGAR